MGHVRDHRYAVHEALNTGKAPLILDKVLRAYVARVTNKRSLRNTPSRAWCESEDEKSKEIKEGGAEFVQPSLDSPPRRNGSLFQIKAVGVLSVLELIDPLGKTAREAGSVHELE